MSSTTNELIRGLAALDDEIAVHIGVLSALPAAQVTERPHADSWSSAQVVHHMADSCMVNAIRTRLLLTEEEARFGGYDERLWTALADANQPVVTDSLSILRGVHGRWAVLLPTLDDADWARTLTHSATHKVSSLVEIMQHYLEHARLHLAQLLALQAALPARQSAASPGAGPAADAPEGADTVMNKERAAFVAQIGALPQQLEALVASLSPEQLTARPLAHEWSVAQNVHHLADSHMNSFVRCKLMLTEQNPHFKPYDQDAWAALPDAGSGDLGASLNVLRSLHARWVALWQSLAGDKWTRTGTNPESGRTYTLDDILRIYAGHGEGHLDQIRRTLAAAR
jgi:uncharacterized damage-inducible protein DinB